MNLLHPKQIHEPHIPGAYVLVLVVLVSIFIVCMKGRAMYVKFLKTIDTDLKN